MSFSTTRMSPSKINLKEAVSHGVVLILYSSNLCLNPKYDALILTGSAFFNSFTKTFILLDFFKVYDTAVYEVFAMFIINSTKSIRGAILIRDPYLNTYINAIQGNK